MKKILVFLIYTPSVFATNVVEPKTLSFLEILTSFVGAVCFFLIYQQINKYLKYSKDFNKAKETLDETREKDKANKAKHEILCKEKETLQKQFEGSPQETYYKLIERKDSFNKKHESLKLKVLNSQNKEMSPK